MPPRKSVAPAAMRDQKKEKIRLEGVRPGTIMSTGGRKQCAVCKSDFRELLGPDGNLVEGCEKCWRENNYEGSVPREVWVPDTRKTANKLQLKMEKDRIKEIEKEKRETESRFQRIADRLETLKSKAPMKRALHGMIKQIWSCNMTELELFNAIDADGNGELERGELKVALRNLGVNLSTSELDGILRAVDLDGNGSVDYQEFYYLLKKEGDAILEEEGQQVHDERMLGFDLGQRVRIKVSIWTEEERQRRNGITFQAEEIEVGTVMGPGPPGTLLVKFDRDDLLLNFRPHHLAKMSAVEISAHPKSCLCRQCMKLLDSGDENDDTDEPDDF